MASYLSQVVGPPQFHEESDEEHVHTLRDWMPHRWKNGERDSVESIGEILGQARDYHLYRKVGCQSWSDYCQTFLCVPAEAMDELIEGVRILQRKNPGCKVSEETARIAAAVTARQQAQTFAAFGDRKSADFRNRRDDITLKDKRGTSSAYTLRRLARTSPETLAAYERGEFSSVAQAARAAGIPVQERSALGSPSKTVEKIIAKGEDYARAVLAGLEKELQESKGRSHG